MHSLLETVFIHVIEAGRVEELISLAYILGFKDGLSQAMKLSLYIDGPMFRVALMTSCASKVLEGHPNNTQNTKKVTFATKKKQHRQTVSFQCSLFCGTCKMR